MYRGKKKQRLYIGFQPSTGGPGMSSRSRGVLGWRCYYFAHFTHFEVSVRSETCCPTPELKRAKRPSSRLGSVTVPEQTSTLVPFFSASSGTLVSLLIRFCSLDHAMEGEVSTFMKVEQPERRKIT